MRFTALFTGLIAAVSAVTAASIEMSPRNLHEFASRQVIEGSVCATVGPYGANVLGVQITVVPSICLCAEAGVLTPDSLARLTAQIQISQSRNPLLGSVESLINTILPIFTRQVASTPATCNYPANSFPLCSSAGTPGGCNFGCDSGFKLCNGGCIPTADTCPSQAKKRDQTSARICPEGWTACPVQVGRKVVWECVNVEKDLESCGGCAAIGQGTDCTALEGVDDVSCIAGKCQAKSCLRGFSVVGDECAPLKTYKPRRISLLQ